mgnify:CR=1 FL=1
MTGPPRAHAPAPEVVALVERKVRCRFSLDARAFASVVQERARTRAPQRSPVEYAASLWLDDLYLATACARGDDDAWRECGDRYFDFMREFARRFLHDAAASDLSDTLIANLWSRDRLAMYDGRSSLRTWLGAMVAHAGINAARARRRTVSLDEELQSRGGARPNTRETAAEQEDNERSFESLVRTALGGLAAEEKLLLLLYYQEELTLDQMSEVLGASKATLSRRLARLRAGLRSRIEQLATRDLGLHADMLRDRLDFSRLDVDLAALLRPVKADPDGGV